MNDEILIAIGRSFLDFSVQREQLIKALQETQKQLTEAKKPPEG